MKISGMPAKAVTYTNQKKKKELKLVSPGKHAMPAIGSARTGMESMSIQLARKAVQP